MQRYETLWKPLHNHYSGCYCNNEHEAHNYIRRTNARVFLLERDGKMYAYDSCQLGDKKRTNREYSDEAETGCMRDLHNHFHG